MKNPRFVKRKPLTVKCIVCGKASDFGRTCFSSDCASVQAREADGSIMQYDAGPDAGPIVETTGSEKL